MTHPCCVKSWVGPQYPLTCLPKGRPNASAPWLWSTLIFISRGSLAKPLGNRPGEHLRRPPDNTKANALASRLPSSPTHPRYPGLACATKGGPSNQSNTTAGAKTCAPAPRFLICGSSPDPSRLCPVMDGPQVPPNMPAKRQAQWQCPMALVYSDPYFPRKPRQAPREPTRGASSQTPR